MFMYHSYLTILKNTDFMSLLVQKSYLTYPGLVTRIKD